MFGIGTTEIIVILVVALLVLGPKKLPEIAKSLGKTLAEFRRVTTDVKRTIEMEVDRDEEIRAKKRIKKEMAGKASKESPDSQEHNQQDPYPEEKITQDAEKSQSEPDKKSGTA
ncbi:Sec-independent protein translocase protein TatB [Desulfonatronovibrio hydrogenovorans]|uniref:Sec-independent protein translocase protein TatB n=1 Tax=Desulfonatronovibrio hydrogenovorans TaxID=53245 RepID=UPI000A017C75|nr:Sec-independent protein translocase protein TatB [Desulfonatronovibrio hydrogenovorans]